MACDGLCQSETLDHAIALGNAEGIVAQGDSQQVRQVILKYSPRG
ncbi:MAG TPA: hypothetical protein VGL94_22330 [Ktedonobacteraceae bacterium]